MDVIKIFVILIPVGVAVMILCCINADIHSIKSLKSFHAKDKKYYRELLKIVLLNIFLIVLLVIFFKLLFDGI